MISAHFGRFLSAAPRKYWPPPGRRDAEEARDIGAERLQKARAYFEARDADDLQLRAFAQAAWPCAFKRRRRRQRA